MNKSNNEIIHDFALTMYDMPNSLCCEYCTKEKCKDKNVYKSCVDCIMDFWRDKTNETPSFRFILETFNKSIEKYGKEPQCRQAMEECAELIQAVNKMLRYEDNPKYYANLIEEIADVEIMLYQLKVMFNIDNDQVFAFKVEKAKREQERLKKL